jgi:DNA-binding Xre family transcriptional regulator
LIKLGENPQAKGYLNFAVFLDLKNFEKIFHLTGSLEKNVMITPSDKKALKKFGENLRKLRNEKDFSLREMSYACSIDNSKIAKIEKGQINITLTTLLQLAVALEVHPSSLLDYPSE